MGPEVDMMEEFETFVGELAQKYQMEQEDVNAIIDNVNMLLGVGVGEEPVPEVVPEEMPEA